MDSDIWAVCYGTLNATSVMTGTIVAARTLNYLLIKKRQLNCPLPTAI